MTASEGTLYINNYSTLPLETVAIIVSHHLEARRNPRYGCVFRNDTERFAVRVDTYETGGTLFYDVRDKRQED